MSKSNRIKSTPIANKIEFLATVSSLAMLEARKRQIEAERDLELQAVNRRFDALTEPLAAQMKGQMALAEAYAEAHREELLPKDAKSVRVTMATYGWRTGNRAVSLLSRVTVDHAIRALKALGLGGYVAQKEEIAKAKILADCQDDKTIAVELGGAWEAGMVKRQVPLADAGLKITQGETFFVEPTSEAAETLKSAAAA